MLTDILGTNNYQVYNVWLAHKIGLNNAIYLDVLINLYRYAVNSGMLFDGDYFILDKEYVKERTTFGEREQSALADTLVSIGLISISPDKESVKVNLDSLVGLSSIASEDVLESFKKIKKTSNKDSKSTYVLQSVKKNIDKKYSKSMNKGFADWLDAVYGKFGFVNNKMLQVAEKKIDELMATDKTKAEKVLELCTINGYKEIDWGIKKYNTLYGQNTVTTTIQETKDTTLSTDFF